MDKQQQFPTCPQRFTVLISREGRAADSSKRPIAQIGGVAFFLAIRSQLPATNTRDMPPPPSSRSRE